MTDAQPGRRSGRLARFLTRAPLTLSRNLWIWPLSGAILISIVGLYTRALVEGTTKTELASRLQTLLNADIAALRLWFSEQEADARSFASDARIRESVLELEKLARTGGVDASALVGSKSVQTLTLYLEPLMLGQGYREFVVIGQDKRILASSNTNDVARVLPPGYEPFFRRALGGRATVSRPFLRADLQQPAVDIPVMFAAAPVRGSDGVVIAVLGLMLKPEDEFSRIFSVARMGETGESYAFDGRGMMLSASRFDQELKMLGLIPKTPDATAILNLRLGDPGVELSFKDPMPRPRGELPLTRMAAAATRGMDGYDIKGYRNYRGLEVIGTWAWLPDYGMGVATEVGSEEAFQTLYVLRRVFLSLFLLLVLSGLAIFAFSLLVERLQASVRKSAIAARRLGQYVLVQEIGRGATGMVYRARHTLLRRPVAIKLLSPDMTDEENIARFEHEVQMTSQLTHPNTVSIYDYGRTPEGLFYYAMEYLSGIDLHKLVKEFGPQPEGRVIHILRQVCGSLAEAHRIGLIHRDIKPANIVLTRRGGVCDLVKVLDFGMVKAVHLGPKGLAPDAVVGTPHFMSPEAVGRPESVDARSDIYSVGAVGYWLLTGKTLFEGENPEALMEKQLAEHPPSVSDHLGERYSQDLPDLIMRCLAKDPAERPESIDLVGHGLATCEAGGAWTSVEAAAWWRAHVAEVEAVPVSTMPEKTLVIAPRA